MKRLILRLLFLTVIVILAGCDSVSPSPGGETTDVPLLPSTMTPYVPPTSGSPSTVAPSPTVIVVAATPTVQPESTPTVAAPDLPDEPPPPEVAEWPAEVARLINAERAAAGLPAMAYNETLARVAQQHANECSQRGACSNTSADGVGAEARLEQEGYFSVQADQSWAMSGTPRDVVAWWMDQVAPDDWNRRMILSERYTEIGIGVAPAEWGYYFIAVFAQP
jgi:uncharacterized protein YkwD